MFSQIVLLPCSVATILCLNNNGIDCVTVLLQHKWSLGSSHERFPTSEGWPASINNDFTVTRRIERPCSSSHPCEILSCKGKGTGRSRVPGTSEVPNQGVSITNNRREQGFEKEECYISLWMLWIWRYLHFIHIETDIERQNGY